MYVLCKHSGTDGLGEEEVVLMAGSVPSGGAFGDIVLEEREM